MVTFAEGFTSAQALLKKEADNRKKYNVNGQIDITGFSLPSITACTDNEPNLTQLVENNNNTVAVVVDSDTANVRLFFPPDYALLIDTRVADRPATVNPSEGEFALVVTSAVLHDRATDQSYACNASGSPDTIRVLVADPTP